MCVTAGADKKISGQSLARKGDAGYVQYAGVGGPLLERQGKKVCAEEILPVVVIDHRVGEVDIGPDGYAFSFWIGGTLKLLEQFEAEGGRCFYLGAERIEQAGIDVNGKVRGRCRFRGNRGNGQYVDACGGVTRIKR